MPELHPGPEVSLGMLEAQLRALGLAYNVGYFLTTVDGHWVLSVNEENYKRWQQSQGGGEPSADPPSIEDSEVKTEESPEDSGAQAKAKAAPRRPAKKGR